jgi:hypothetical protein
MANPSLSAVSFKATETLHFIALLRECLLATPLGVLSQALTRRRAAGAR